MIDAKLLLKHIQKTNPGMTEEKMLEELNKCSYSSTALVMVWLNSEKCQKKQTVVSRLSVFHSPGVDKPDFKLLSAYTIYKCSPIF